ncbi:hypothetical protein ACGF0J_21815 [Nonomuraea sp. NPDC047897]|uniref:hypothetical protein n=1 Tax=Nonomuraea sp. NPDC047897 TaxID=3364346 RepID=UPI00372442E7
MRALTILAAPVALAVAVVAVAWILARAQRARDDRRARLRHEAFLSDLHKQAIAHSGANVLADYFADEIRTHLSMPEKEITR